MPVVINISYGTNNGSHDGTSLFETFVDEIAQKWKTSIVVASGNEGAAAHHYSAQINSGEINDARFYTSDGLRSFYISCWKNFVDSFTIELILPDGKSTGEISEVDRIRTWRFGNIRVSIDFNQPNQYSENQEIFFQAGVLNGYLASGQWIVRIRAIKSVVGRFDMWLPVLEEISAGTAFFNPDPHITITLPATSERVISVGGYNHRTDTFADFSGRGFTREGRHKPDICAPAVGILTPRKGGGYDAFTGTSIAAPIVTGSVALLMEWGITQGNDPFLYGQKIKAYLKSGAIRIATQSYPNPEWGYGKLCLRNSMEQLAQYF
jgi:subtilisin family serine protease